jgi:prepilin-type N-terminal cleavage/methylation domain-containing protein/prepilin-type processing-associated H-X9-DG protein
MHRFTDAGKRRPGVTLIELLVVIAIIAILIGLLLPAVQKVRESASRTQCVNNMKQLGLAMHSYNDVNSMFPNEGGEGGTGQTNTSFYVFILPYMEQGNLYSTMVNGTTVNVNAATPIAGFLCPSRRNTQVGAKTDYASVFDDSIQHLGPSGNGDLDTIMGASVAAAQRTILNNSGVGLTDVTNGAGTSNTLLLGHKVMSTGNYAATNGPNDRGWAYYSAGNSYDHMRWTDANNGTPGKGEHGYIQDTINVDNNHMGGPHPNGSPVLYADGSIRIYTYLYVCPPVSYNGTMYTLSDDATWQAMWSYTRGFTVTPPQ